MTIYLIDADVLIRAHEDYYPVDRVAPFWAWLLRQAEAGVVKMAPENHGEISGSTGLLADWIRGSAVKDALILDEPANVGLVRRVVTQGYAPDLTDVEIEKIGRDPFLIAAALAAPDRVVVTREVSAPSKQRANRKIPDICNSFNIRCINDFALWRILNFRIR